MPLDKQYDPAQFEPAIYKKWEESGAFTPRHADTKPYVIMLPPPNITGTLHIGHALQDTIMDVLIRYHRMLGQPTLWLPGTDSAAIATNRVLEEQLAAEGKTRQQIGREEFLRRADAWYAKTGQEIIQQMKRLGVSCDWSRLRYTLDEAYIQAVNQAFVEFYKRGYLYRGERIVNWDPASQTTVSDLEIDWHTEKAPFYTLQYGPFQIGTARPETKFGDKYVVMHPADARYQQYQHGETFEAEWINGPVTATVIKDESIDPAFGTGAMTITPWHDAADFAIAERHNLDKQQIIGFDGKLLPIAGACAGLTINEARPKIIEQLTKKGLLVAVDENYQHSVALNNRGKGVIEPQVMRQWFVDMSQLKDKALQAAAQESVRFVPTRWKKHFMHWLENVYDWNVNRQIWLGHRLPVWWKPGTHGTEHEEGNFVVSVDPPAGGGEGWEQDPDVLDTWFATALWPFATLGWPRKSAARSRGKPSDLELFYPTSVLVTARDILYLWVARMVFSGLEFMGDVPFREVFIHPTVLAKDGRRMSKSLGTGVDPLGLITTYGADAIRFGLMYQLHYDSQAIKFDEEAIKSGRNFVNKIWNIGRLLESIPKRDTPTIADQWITQRLHATIQQVTQSLEQYRFGEAAHVLYDFVWRDVADWYLEILKVEGSTTVARQVFAALLRLLHPFMPHVTEVLWEKSGRSDLLMTAAWPTAGKVEAATDALAHFQDIVSTTRRARALFDIPPKVVVDLAVTAAPLPQALAALSRARLVPAATAAMKTLPLALGGQISLGASSLTPEAVERARQKLTRQIEELQQAIARGQAAVRGMRGKAPAAVIAAKETVLANNQAQLVQLERSQTLLYT